LRAKIFECAGGKASSGQVPGGTAARLKVGGRQLLNGHHVQNATEPIGLVLGDKTSKRRLNPVSHPAFGGQTTPATTKSQPIG